MIALAAPTLAQDGRGVDAARGRPVTCDAPLDYGYPGDIVDGDDNTGTSWRQCVVDFEYPLEIDRYRLRLDWDLPVFCHAYPSSVDVELSEDGTTWSGTNPAWSTEVHRGTHEVDAVIPIEPAIARFARVTFGASTTCGAYPTVFTVSFYLRPEREEYVPGPRPDGPFQFSVPVDIVVLPGEAEDFWAEFDANPDLFDGLTIGIVSADPAGLDPIVDPALADEIAARAQASPPPSE